MAASILLIMSIIMVISSLILYFIGTKRNITGISLWVAAPFIRGLNWFVEFLAEEFSKLDEVFIIDRIEISLAFLASFSLLGAILVYSKVSNTTQAIRIIAPAAILSVFFMFTFPKTAIVNIEDYTLELDPVETEPLRFMYGFLIPFVAFLILTNTAIRSQLEEEQNSTIMRIIILLFLFSIFEGFDYDQDWYQLTRSVILFSILFLPLLVIVTSKIKLERLLLIDKIGLPLFAYSFRLKKSEITDHVMLTSGYITALLGLSEEISEEQSSLSVESGNLFYTVEKTSNGLCMLQSNAVNSDLQNQFQEFVAQVSSVIENITEVSEIDPDEISSLVLNKFRFYL
jgi:hypothetical protein